MLISVILDNATIKEKLPHPMPKLNPQKTLAIALVVTSLLLLLPLLPSYAQFPPTVSYDWKAMTQKTPQDCQKAAQASVKKLFSQRIQERKNGTCGQGRGFTGCLICIDEQKLVVGISTGFDSVQTEAIVKQLLGAM
jgi:hypothetical protein